MSLTYISIVVTGSVFWIVFIISIVSYLISKRRKSGNSNPVKKSIRQTDNAPGSQSHYAVATGGKYTKQIIPVPEITLYSAGLKPARESSTIIVRKPKRCEVLNSFPKENDFVRDYYRNTRA